MHTIYITGKQITLMGSEIYKDLNNELEILVDWFYANKLCLNRGSLRDPGETERSRGD